MAVAFRVFLALRVLRTLVLQREERPLFLCQIGKTRPAVPGKGKTNVQYATDNQFRASGSALNSFQIGRNRKELESNA